VRREEEHRGRVSENEEAKSSSRPRRVESTKLTHPVLPSPIPSFEHQHLHIPNDLISHETRHVTRHHQRHPSQPDFQLLQLKVITRCFSDLLLPHPSQPREPQSRPSSTSIRPIRGLWRIRSDPRHHRSSVEVRQILLPDEVEHLLLSRGSDGDLEGSKLGHHRHRCSGSCSNHDFSQPGVA